MNYSSGSHQAYNFTLSCQHEVTTQANSSNFDDKRGRRGRGRGSRGSYKPRSRAKPEDKYSSKKDDFPSVYINPKILLQLGLTTYPDEPKKPIEIPLNNNTNQIENSNRNVQTNTPSGDYHQNRPILNGAEVFLELDNQEDSLYSKDLDDNFTLTAYYTT